MLAYKLSSLPKKCLRLEGFIGKAAQMQFLQQDHSCNEAVESFLFLIKIFVDKYFASEGYCAQDVSLIHWRRDSSVT